MYTCCMLLPHLSTSYISLRDILLRHLGNREARLLRERKHAQRLLVHRRIDHDPVEAVRAAPEAVVELKRELYAGSLEDC